MSFCDQAVGTPKSEYTHTHTHTNAILHHYYTPSIYRGREQKRTHSLTLTFSLAHSLTHSPRKRVRRKLPDIKKLKPDRSITLLSIFGCFFLSLLPFLDDDDDLMIRTSQSNVAGLVVKCAAGLAPVATWWCGGGDGSVQMVFLRLCRAGVYPPSNLLL